VSDDGFGTATLADIYARQGHYDKARAIYERLTAERPDDADLNARFQAMLALAATDASGAGDERDARLARLDELLTRVRRRRRS